MEDIFCGRFSCWQTSSMSFTKMIITLSLPGIQPLKIWWILLLPTQRILVLKKQFPVAFNQKLVGILFCYKTVYVFVHCYRIRKNNTIPNVSTILSVWKIFRKIYFLLKNVEDKTIVNKALNCIILWLFGKSARSGTGYKTSLSLDRKASTGKRLHFSP